MKTIAALLLPVLVGQWRSDEAFKAWEMRCDGRPLAAIYYLFDDGSSHVENCTTQTLTCVGMQDRHGAAAHLWVGGDADFDNIPSCFAHDTGDVEVKVQLWSQVQLWSHRDAGAMLSPWTSDEARNRARIEFDCQSHANAIRQDCSVDYWASGNEDSDGAKCVCWPRVDAGARTDAGK